MPFYLPVERFDRKTKTKRSERGPPMIILALTDPGLGVGQDPELQFKVASLSKTTSCFYHRWNPLGVRTNFNTIKISTCSKEDCFDCLIDLTNKHVLAI